MKALLLLGAAAASLSVMATAVSAKQAAISGQAVYARACAACHLASLAGSGPSPALAGAEFLPRWRDLTGGDLLKRISTTMPPEAPNSLTPAEYRAVTAFVLDENKVGGGKPVPTGAAELEAFVIN